MKVAVKLHGILRDYRPRGARTDLFDVLLGEPAVVRSALDHFGIPARAVQAAFLNDEPVELDAPLKDGDHVRLFPPVVGGADRSMRVFIGGIMQGSLRENTISGQDYRRAIGDCLRQFLPGVEIIDPLELHPDSIGYAEEAARQTLIILAREAGRADALIAYVPEASMGTALEMWEAYHNRRPIFTISPLIHNWVVKGLSTRVFVSLDEFYAFVSCGDFERSIFATRRIQSEI